MKHSDIWRSPYRFSEKQQRAHALALISLAVSALPQRSQNRKADPPALASWPGLPIFIIVLIVIVIIIITSILLPLLWGPE